MAYPTAKTILGNVSIKFDAVTVGTFALPDGTTCKVKTVKSQELAASAADVAVDLAGFAETCKLFWVKPLSGTAVAVGVGTGAAPASTEKITVGATGFLMAAPSGAASQKLYLTNLDAVSSLIEIGVLGDFTADA